MTTEDPKVIYPLHYHVWNNDYMALDELLHQKKYDIEKLDPHGRTPLMLCIVLDHLESARVLLRHGANACVSTDKFWTAAQEAIATGDPELVKLILVHRDAQIVRHQAAIVADLLQKLRETPDFYIEMKWEFTSWLPLVSRMCPSDVCRVWKCGSNVRIDTNLLGFNGSASWVRGHLSYMFRAGESGAYMDEVNHTDRTIYRHNVNLLSGVDGAPSAVSGAGAAAAAAAQLFVREPSESTIANKLTQPIFVTYLDTDKVEFEKSKSGILGWRSDRKETINNHPCQIYCASNVQIITLRRTEHLTEENLHDLNQQHHSNDNEHGTGGGLVSGGCGASDIVFPGGRGNLLTNLLQTAASETHTKTDLAVTHEAASYNPNHVTPQQYFSSDVGTQLHLDAIGRPKVMTTKVKTFKARLWICHDYPLSLKDQIIPIIDLMSEYNPYFHKLKEFLTKQLPSGFPLKVEIPLYHVLNACVSFGNLHGQDNSVFGVSTIPASNNRDSTDLHKKTDSFTTSGKLTSDNQTDRPLLESSTESSASSQPVRCIIDESVFDVGKGYHLIVENSPGHYGALYDEEQMVQMAVQRSLIEYGSSENLIQRDYSLSKHGIIEARADAYVEPEEAWLQQAIAASLSLDGAEIPVTSADAAYMKALEDSRIEQELEEKRRRAEDEELARILELSTKEK
ncbi:Ankyrin repeat domain-containing protein isoform 1 [Schistosoma japonicum]|uniref:Ankyrin repeat domain-containing protein isoform 1 n=3 Tax=Schistosoma japonicum TaxID=6182 RepID=A0A4Z2DUC8_SCHJA|nr:Ankyrin repeat domain-containing protein 13D [Schistosoma japonicum]KAH8853570.1 Ankyrin repeat domain-containing protein 13D [Schistosoma japonicum]KAH8853572.1 Ankyrin repeat domain-containing protein 13D [Schistosoma japonicum]TNN19789.1 Ankyrin repeat domain-containing protein isoform 1 [Schistosoma japonicum]TNN19790.1 Ankyrin repeat domain-containing protein isoform 1 [Schistosoma japonicum]